jgi:hypothetical protein
VIVEEIKTIQECGFLVVEGGWGKKIYAVIPL